jgi:hypothetical protein
MGFAFAFIILFLMSGCTDKSVPQEKFTMDQKIAYNFSNNVYRNDTEKFNAAVDKWVFDNENNRWIMRDKLSRGKFTISNFQKVEILRSTKIVDHDRHVDLVLVKIYGREIENKKVIATIVHTNIVYLVDHKIFLTIMSNDGDDSQDFKRLMTAF